MPHLTIEQRAEAENHIREIQTRDREGYDRLRQNAQAVYKAMEGWHLVEGPEGWARTCEQSQADYQSGRFLIERLGPPGTWTRP